MFRKFNLQLLKDKIQEYSKSFFLVATFAISFIMLLFTIYDHYSVGNICIEYVYNNNFLPINYSRESDVFSNSVNKSEFYFSENTMTVYIRNCTNEPRVLHNLKLSGAREINDLAVDSENISVMDKIDVFLKYEHDKDLEIIRFPEISIPPKSVIALNLWGNFAGYSYKDSIEAVSNVPVKIERYHQIYGFPYFVAKNLIYILFLVSSILLINILNMKAKYQNREK